MKHILPLVLLLVFPSSQLWSQSQPKAKPDTTVTIDLRKLDPVIARLNTQLDQAIAERRQASDDPAGFLRDVIRQLEDNIKILQTALNAYTTIKTDSTFIIKKPQ